MKTILITGATQGLGRATAEKFVQLGHSLIIHGRDAERLEETRAALGGSVQTVQADLSDLDQVAEMADRIVEHHSRIDVLINNAGVYKMPDPVTGAGLDARFVVNTLAPALLTLKLLPVISEDGRIIHLSSAAQSPVDPRALRGDVRVQDMQAYAQSKLAIALWSQQFAAEHPDGPVSIAVNPGSLLATRMVREGFGTSGNDINIGTDILVRAALASEFTNATGRYWDNDARRYGRLYPADLAKSLSQQVDDLLKR
ncbi:SDR family NAD(P)-dependent oxidoreductase [Amaricoccus macauensis]|uniref:SDR family NAD(P)-dependent oxidoreductase n=1 Tax=Amaricoccus macauensis TaxID=57001 RepID=UPI003C7DCE27